MKEVETVIPTTLSVLTLMVLYKQYSNQLYRVKMDLFDRRFKVYSHLRKFILTVSTKGTNLEVVQKFMSDVPEYEFIFDKDGEMVRYINDLLDKGLDYTQYQEDIKNENSYPFDSIQREELNQKRLPLGRFFLHEFENVKHRFSKYLYLGEVEEDDFLSNLSKKIRQQTGNLVI
jgi:hypothetical protein